jgi:hypothetical protein
MDSNISHFRYFEPSAFATNQNHFPASKFFQMNLCVVIPKTLILILALGTCAVSFLLIVLTGVYGTDRATPSMYDGSVCTDSVFNEYRPFRASFETVMGNITNYKICSRFYKGNTTRCFRGDTHVDANKYVYCGWSNTRVFQHISSHLLLITFTLFGILWTIKDLGYWIIVGIIYTILVAIGVLFSFWIFLMDAIDVTSARSFCDTTFQSLYCSPARLIPEVVQKCTCEFGGYTFTGPILHFFSTLLWIVLFVACCVRWFAYRYQNVTGDEINYEKQRTPLFNEEQKQEKVKEIYSKYGF